jgi:hypothetical protein
MVANLNAKSKRLRHDLKFWSKSISKLSVCIENTNRAILEIDNIEDCRPLSCPEANFRKILRAHLLRLLEYQNTYWKKRCTIRWTKFGDENTKVFHSIATKRHRRNSISAIDNSDGIVITDHAQKEALIYDTYKERLGSSNQPQMLFDLSAIIQPTQGLEELTIPFTKEEIDNVIKSMPVDKAPGPNGFNGQFLKSTWHIIKHDIYKLCEYFYEGN